MIFLLIDVGIGRGRGRGRGLGLGHRGRTREIDEQLATTTNNWPRRQKPHLYAMLLGFGVMPLLLDSLKWAGYSLEQALAVADPHGGATPADWKRFTWERVHARLLADWPNTGAGGELHDTIERHIRLVCLPPNGYPRYMRLAGPYCLPDRPTLQGRAPTAQPGRPPQTLRLLLVWPPQHGMWHSPTRLRRPPPTASHVDLPRVSSSASNAFTWKLPRSLLHWKPLAILSGHTPAALTRLHTYAHWTGPT